MALRDLLPSFGRANPDEVIDAPDARLMGHTDPAPDPGTIRPRVGAPIGQSGRANFYGLPQWDELNPKLIGPAGQLLFDEMYRTDAHVRRLVLAAWSPVVAGTWSLEPYGGENASQQDRDIAEAIWWGLTTFMSPNFHEHLCQLGPLLLRAGFTPCEQIWGTPEYKGKTLLMPRKLDFRLPRTIWQWWQDDFGELTHIGQILPNRPSVIIPASELTYYRLGAEGDNWSGVSLLRHAFKNWMLKDKLERLDAIGQERKAVGMPVLYHDPGVPEDQLSAIERALATMHVSEVAYLMLPGRKMGMAGQNASPGSEFLVDVIKFDSSSGDGIRQSIDYHQQAISASFLTDFLELGHHQVGARATAEVQQDPFLTAINGALLPPVVPRLNELVDRIRKLNWKDADGSPTLQLTMHDEASLSEIATYVQMLVAAEVIQVDPDLEDWARERASLPVANADWRDLKQQAQKAALENAAKAAQNPMPVNQDPNEPPNPDAVPPARPGQRATPPAKQGQQPPAPAEPAPAKQSAKQLDQDAIHADVAIDFDGVIHPQGDEPLTEGPIKGALAGMDELVGKYSVVVYTARSELGAVRKWLAAHGFPKVPVTNRKPVAKHYIDDHAFPDGFPGWDTVSKKLLDGDFAPMSGGTGGVGGLQMVPDVAGECECEKPRGKDGVCQRCGLPLAKQLDDAPTVKWFERLLSQDKLRQALDGARDHIEQSCAQPALKAAGEMAHGAANGIPVTTKEPPAELVDALTRHYEGLYRLGHGTVQAELAKQRRALGRKTLDDPAASDAGLTGARLARARQRGEHSARNIANKVSEVLGRQQITGLQDPVALHEAAQQAATGALRVEALANASPMISDGRYDAAMGAGDVVGAYYTSVLDERTCQPCAGADDGTLLTPDVAVGYGPPNPNCDGSDRCRCMLVWVLSSDPAALAAVT